MRLNEGPLPSKVLVPREFVATVHTQFVEIKDKMETVISKYKKDKDATRKRHERAKNKLVKQIQDLQGVIADKEAAANLLEIAAKNQTISADKLRAQLATAQTDLVNARTVISELTRDVRTLKSCTPRLTEPPMS
eukprot:jgi/Mesvir1/16760/Mv15133-RA.1